jgi:hypothetical protein
VGPESDNRRTARTRASIGSLVALGLAAAACVPRSATGINCNFEGRGLAAVLNQVDAAPRDAAAVSGDAGADAGGAVDTAGRRGCVDGSVCPTGTVLLMATYTPPCADRKIVCRRSTARPPARWERRPTPDATADAGDVEGDPLTLSGDVTRAAVDAIVAAVARVDALPMLSIDQTGDAASATTGCKDSCVVGSGWSYRLRRVAGAWIIDDRSQWLE